MSRQEFIDRLRAALNGRIPAAQVEDTVNYYQDYINTEIRKGRTEEDVLQSLGDPRLIARTIVQTSGTSENGYYQESAGERYTDTAYNMHNMHRGVRIPGWLMAILVILLMLLIISVVFSVLSFLAPFLIVFFAVVFLVKLFRDWLN